MQVVILCGGSGTRMREETEFRPKPMVHVGGKPILWHIMKYYSCFGHNDFLLALGYKQEIIREYFRNFDILNMDYKLLINNNSIIDYYPIDLGDRFTEPWNVSLIDTGENSLKGSRLKQVEKYITDDTFLMTYGDGIGNINIDNLIRFHHNRSATATVTGVLPLSRFGEIHHDSEGNVTSFAEKKKTDSNNLINGGFFVFNKDIFNYLVANEWCDLEHGPLEVLAERGKMAVYKHTGFWGCMDTVVDVHNLNEIWRKEKPWKLWKD
jgi:glucose-1-phosphate cytidylyltransferase